MDTKTAVQSQATNTEDTDEIQEAETAVPRLRQVTIGTQTESGNSLQEAKTSNLKETLSEETHSDGDNAFWTIPAQRHKSETKNSQKGQSRDPYEGCAHCARLMDSAALRASHLQIDSSSESRHLCRRCRPPRAGGSGLACPQPGCCAGRGSRLTIRQRTPARFPTPMGHCARGVSRS